MTFIVFEVEDLTGAFENMCGLFNSKEDAIEWILNEGEGKAIYSSYGLKEFQGYRHFNDWYLIEEVQFLKSDKDNIDSYFCSSCGGMGWKSAATPLQECPECEGIGYKQ